MTFFESLLALLLAAIVLLQVSRRLSLPYPAMLAAAGVAVALIPGAPTLSFEPETALALFIAPVVLDAAFDFPISSVRRMRRQLILFAVFVVLATTALVAFLGWSLVGLPVAAALALGAIVAPPDAAAATAVLRSVSIPRSADTLLKGESLFNDATALLLFSASLAVVSSGSLTSPVALRIALAVPGGVLLGYVAAFFLRRVSRFVSNTLGGNLMQFVIAYLVWILAQRLHLSAVLCTISFAMVLANDAEITAGARMRVQSYAVWSAVVFSLNVFAFLLMGLQGRSIVSRMNPANLRQSFIFATIIVAAVIIVRFVIVMGVDRLTAWWNAARGRRSTSSWRLALLEAWTGMRGFVTLATAFALPPSFPQRDLVVLTAFLVVLATLVLQGLTLVPLVRLLKLDRGEAFEKEILDGRGSLTHAALKVLESEAGSEAENLRFGYQIQIAATDDHVQRRSLNKRRELGIAAVRAQRAELDRLRSIDSIGANTYLFLQEELDWMELTFLCDNERRIEES